MTSLKTTEMYNVWGNFLKKWPIQALRSMSLAKYHSTNEAGQDSLVRWLEAHTECLGSIWGGSAFKFGIFQRKDHSHKTSSGGLSYDEHYGWYTKYGATPEDAFRVVHKLILEIVTKAKAGDYFGIDAIDFSPAIKWKLAFLYQPQNKPFMPYIYKKELLKKIFGKGTKLSMAEMYQQAMRQQKGRDLLEYSEELYQQAIQQLEDGVHLKSTDETSNANLPATQCPSRSVPNVPLNRIFYGPPGTGKTWRTVDAALEVLDPDAFKLEERKERKERFDALCQEGRVRMVTFHQSFSYEDFVEGIRPETIPENEEGAGHLSYNVKSGIFKEICEAAVAKTVYASGGDIDLAGRRIWKMSLGNSLGETAYIYDECIKENRLLMGYGRTLDFSSCRSENDIRDTLKNGGYAEQDFGSYALSALSMFVLQMSVGDIVIISEGLSKFRAIAEITGGYMAINREAEGDHYGQGRPVRWLRQFDPALPANSLMERQFSQMTLYRPNLDEAEKNRLQNLLAPVDVEGTPESHVLIIDEINRGNIAGIFGELITLIEPSKRAAAEDALCVRLPYSGKLFEVPSNLYIIGTMNTADRSLTGLDIALRRRFTFVEMIPNPGLLSDKLLEGTEISIGKILEVMNLRIELLLDRDHCLGHAPFMGLGDAVSVNELENIFKYSIIPLLQEYFFEDWEKIRHVLNDTRKKDEAFKFIRKKKMPDDILEAGVLDGLPRQVWEINDQAFNKLSSYIGIINPDYQLVRADGQVV